MFARIIPIGNTVGVRVPKALLKAARLKAKVEINVVGSSLVIRATNRRPREGWEAAFRDMARQGDDRLDPEWSGALSSFDEEK